MSEAEVDREWDEERLRGVSSYRVQMETWMKTSDTRHPNIRTAGILCSLLNEYEEVHIPIIKSKHAKNGHYNACCWSDPKNIDGPDNCDCNLASMRWHDIVYNARKLKLH